MTVIAGAALLIVVLASAAILLAGRAAAPVIVGKAKIYAQSASLRGKPRDDAATITTVDHGATVELLNRVPEKAPDAWVFVRSTAKKPASGFIRLNSLEGVKTGIADFDLWCARGLIPDPAKVAPAELRARLRDAEATLARLMRGSESMNLHLRIATTYALLARNDLPDRAAAKKDADVARRYLEELQDWGVSPSESESLRASLDELMKAAPSVGVPKSNAAAGRQPKEKLQSSK